MQTSAAYAAGADAELMQALVHAQVVLHHSCDALSKLEVFEAAALQYNCSPAWLSVYPVVRM